MKTQAKITIDKSKLKIVELKEGFTDILELYYDSNYIGFALGTDIEALGNSGYIPYMDTIDKKIYFSEHVEIFKEFQNQGFGTYLKKKQIEFAKKHGYSKLETSVNNENITSIKMQLNAGCKVKKGKIYSLVYIEL